MKLNNLKQKGNFDCDFDRMMCFCIIEDIIFLMGV